MEKIKSYLNGIILFVLIIGIGAVSYYYIKKDLNKKNNSAKNGENVSYTTEIPLTTNLTEEYKNDDHKISFKYQTGWQSKDLGGNKNVTTPLTRENIIYFYEPINGSEEKVGATIRVLRFVLENNTKINSSDDWYNYIKKKIDDFVANKDLSKEVGYELISVEKVPDIDGHFAVREDYKRKDGVRGRDYYIYNDNDFYQFVTNSNQETFDSYSSYFDEIVNSFRTNK